jgi:monoamine oxidase
VVGAGLAGLRAARDIARAGRTAIVLEARERVGGRGYSSRLGGRVVELGGSWFTPEQDQVRRELAEAGLGVRDYPGVEHARWLTDGVLRTGLPVPWDEVGALEAALQRVARDARLVAEGHEAVGAVSAADYVESMSPSPALRDFLLGWWQLMGGAPPERGAVLDALASVASHGGLAGLVTCLAHGPAEGWSALAGALAASPGVDVRLGQAAASVAHNDRGVACTTRDGSSLAAGAAVVAVPLNCLPDIAFEPALPSRIAEAAGANVGATVKLLMRATGLPGRSIAVGAGPGLEWLYADPGEDGEAIVTGFGWHDPGFDPSDRAAVERALCAFFPEAALLGYEHHDWIGDPASRGTWLTAPAGRIDLVDPARFRPEGRLRFAGSDMASEHAGWFEGALRSGAVAAASLLEVPT